MVQAFPGFQGFRRLCLGIGESKNLTAYLYPPQHQLGFHLGRIVVRHASQVLFGVLGQLKHFVLLEVHFVTAVEYLDEHQGPGPDLVAKPELSTTLLDMSVSLTTWPYCNNKKRLRPMNLPSPN